MKKLSLLIGLSYAAAVMYPVAAAEKLPAFPGAQGFGAFTPGGRGGKVLFVTNLNDNGPGSLRAACAAKGPRIVIFRVSGNIDLKDKLEVTEPFLTIAGQTAPGDGLCLCNDAFVVGTHDLVVRHLRFRPGDTKRKEVDAVSIRGHNIVFDHCSASWAVDEVLSPTPCQDVTIQWCIISEALNESVHHKGAHGYGSLITGPAGGVTFHHNIYAHNNSRNPRPGAAAGTAGIILDFRNNLIYDWGSKAGYSNQSAVRMNYVANYLKPGPSTKSQQKGVAFSAGGLATKIFIADNLIVGFPERNRNNQLMLTAGSSFDTAHTLKECLSDQPFAAPDVITEPPQVAYQKILADCGATLPKRDSVDARIIHQITTGTGRIINSQTEVGAWLHLKPAPPPKDTDEDGMPDEWETKHGLNPNANDNTSDRDGDGYTNIEEYLNATDPNNKNDPAIFR